MLTTLIARGVYSDPDYGLNNLAIPDSLSRQDYWYRSVFDAPELGIELIITDHHTIGWTLPRADTIVLNGVSATATCATSAGTSSSARSARR